MKSVSLFSRKPGLTQADFRRHYEEVHAPLALQHFAFDRYARNFVDSASGALPWVACIGEFWIDESAAKAPFSDPKVAEAFAEDRALFMGEQKLVSRAQEQHLAGPPRGFDRPGTRRVAILAADTEKALQIAANIRDDQTSAIDRMTLDILSDAEGWPGNALLWIWCGNPASPQLSQLDAAARFSVETVESELIATPN